MKLKDTIVAEPYTDEEMFDLSNVVDVPLWESTKNNKCTLTEHEQNEITDRLTTLTEGHVKYKDQYVD